MMPLIYFVQSVNEKSFINLIFNHYLTLGFKINELKSFHTISAKTNKAVFLGFIFYLLGQFYLLRSCSNFKNVYCLAKEVMN